MKNIFYILIAQLLLVIVLVPSTAKADISSRHYSEGAKVASLTEGFNFVEEKRAEVGVGKFTLKTFILKILRIITTIVAVIAAAALVWGGFMYITSIGQDDKIATAKKIIIYALVGLVVIGFAGMIVNLLINLTKKA